MHTYTINQKKKKTKGETKGKKLVSTAHHKEDNPRLKCDETTVKLTKLQLMPNNVLKGEPILLFPKIILN